MKKWQGKPPDDGLQRWIEFLPAWDKRNTDPKKDFGVHGVEMRWVLKGWGGAITFHLYTNWMLPETWAEKALLPTEKRLSTGYHYQVPHGPMDDTIAVPPMMMTEHGYHYRVPTGPMSTDEPSEWGPNNEHLHLFCRPNPAGIFYHSKWSRDDDEKPVANDCDVLDDGKCYSDGSYLHASDIFVDLLRGGSDAVWLSMLKYYRAWIERVAPPEDERVTFGQMLQQLTGLLDTSVIGTDGAPSPHPDEEARDER